MSDINVKIFSEKDEEKLEKKINDFIRSVEIIDIKFTTTDFPIHSVMILYKLT